MFPDEKGTKIIVQIPIGYGASNGPAGRSDLAHSGFTPHHIGLLHKAYNTAVQTEGYDSKSEVAVYNAAVAILEKPRFAAEVVTYMNVATTKCIRFMQQHGTGALSGTTIPNSEESRGAARSLGMYADQAGISGRDTQIFRRYLDIAIASTAKAPPQERQPPSRY